MERDFYRGHLRAAGIEALVPDEEERGFVHDTVYEELVQGRFRDESRGRMVAIIERLRQRGAQGVVLGCTEIPLLVRQEHCGLPLFDTLQIHADAAVDEALTGE